MSTAASTTVTALRAVSYGDRATVTGLRWQGYGDRATVTELRAAVAGSIHYGDSAAGGELRW